MKNLFIYAVFFYSLQGLAQSITHPRSIVDPDFNKDSAMASPFPSPPFPMSDWNGGPVIGKPVGESPDYLMKAIQTASKKSWTKWNKSRIKIYGWVDGSVNLSSSKQTNSPMSYDILPNKLVLDQFIFRIQREPNTAQRNHADWGFLIDNIYGIDYRYTISKGYVSDQLIKYNHIYGYDPTQVYGLIYIPKVAKGMLLKIGRFISPADIEAQWAPDNYLFSHSLMFTVDPYTFTGINSSIRISRRVQIELGMHFGNDMAPWSNSAQLNGLGMIRWISKNNANSFYGGLNSIGRGKYKNGHDDLQMLVGVWGHKFSKRLHMMTESYYLWEYDAAKGGSAIYGPVRYGQGGGMGQIKPGLSKTTGIVNYFQILCSVRDYISIRNEALNDIDGNRTGYATWYHSHTIGWSHHFADQIIMRPEVRYEKAWNKNHITPYDGGTKSFQFTAAVDLIVRF